PAGMPFGPTGIARTSASGNASATSTRTGRDGIRQGFYGGRRKVYTTFDRPLLSADDADTHCGHDPSAAHPLPAQSHGQDRRGAARPPRSIDPGAPDSARLPGGLRQARAEPDRDRARPVGALARADRALFAGRGRGPDRRLAAFAFLVVSPRRW